MSNENFQNNKPVSLDVDPEKEFQKAFDANQQKKVPSITVTQRTSSADSVGLTLKSPRTARFAEATSVNSPIDGHNPFSDPPRTRHLMPQPQPSDVGFGYVADQQASKHNSYAGVEVPLTPASPLKSALKVPGTPGRALNPLSPTFKEEEVLDKQELKADKANAKDLKIKTRVRMAKMALRGVNFSCSLIVLSMLATTFQIFNVSRNLPNRGKSPPWAPQQQTWPQITLLCIACVSLAMSLGIIFAYFRGGHRRAEKAAVYYTVFAIVFFIFSIVMWTVGAVILNESRNKGKDQDMWGWSCKDGKRKTLFEQDVDYALSCRLQNWSLVCAFIEIIVEVITISIYGIVFYRFYSKRKLHKSMGVRDKAREDLYLAQLRTQSAPNTPGFKSPMSPAFPKHLHDDDDDDLEAGKSIQYAEKRQSSFGKPKAFALQAPPIKVQQATPTVNQEQFDAIPETQAEHVPAAPGEQEYESVPIPGAYASPLSSPSFAPAQPMSFGQAVSGSSPPGSPRMAAHR